jgi:hypothetical protein
MYVEKINLKIMALPRYNNCSKKRKTLFCELSHEIDGQTGIPSNIKCTTERSNLVLHALSSGEHKQCSTLPIYY